MPSDVAKHRLLIVGLDGAGWPVLDRLFRAGSLPALRRLAQSGVRTDLRSTLPPATLPAWTSFLTCSGPGEHGVVDIFMREPGTYRLRPASGHDRRLPTFLSRLSAAGLRVASAGVPGTFPPETVNGICIAGFDAPGAGRARPDAIWPPSLHAEIERLGGWRYATFNEHATGEARLAQAVRALKQDLATKERILLALLEREPWDVFLAHLQASDTVAHHLWHTFDTNSPRHAHAALRDGLPGVYERLDRLIGRLVGAAGPDARVLIVSDHGMGGASRRQVHLNRWLHHQGLLAFGVGPLRQIRGRLGNAVERAARLAPRALLNFAVERAPQGLFSRALSFARRGGLDLQRCLAFSDELDYAPSVWIHTKGAFPAGVVEPRDVPLLRQRIREGLMRLSDPETGDPLVQAVHDRESAQPGPFAELAPDLLVEPAWPGGYRPSFVPSRGPGPALGRLTTADAGKGAGMPGVHRRDGIFLAVGPGLPEAVMPVIDIATAGALVFALLGVPVPDDLSAPMPAFLDDFFPHRRGPAQKAPPATRHSAYNNADASRVTDRLRDMGYID
jgi:predicted AlkP superfamily phosphohydrolase/phosphomutase